MKYGFTLHHNGPAARCVGQPHDRCIAFWRAVRRYHMVSKGWSDIAYSFGVCPHGIRFDGRGWDRSQWANGRDVVGANDGSDRDWYTVLAFLGGSEQPTDAMVAGLRTVILEGRATGRCGRRVLPHNRFKIKACPGPELTDLAYTWDGTDLAATAPPPLPEENDLYGTDIVASYIEAGQDLSEPTVGTAVRVWNHTIYAKPEGERDGGIKYIRHLLGLPTD